MVEMEKQQPQAFENKVYPIERPIPRLVINESSDEFVISWKDMKYVVTKSLPERIVGYLLGQRNTPKRTLILKGLSGRVSAGQLVAVMGPSGSGKTTLLECIVGKRFKGRNGEIVCSSNKPLIMSFIPQHDQFFNTLTVRETLTFASKVLNSTVAFRGNGSGGNSLLDPSTGKPVSESVFHETVVNQLLARLKLEVCADNRISNCSGGQLKRVSIAQELARKPDVLILDEPTSGLDSSACHLLVEYLRQLAVDDEHPMVIMMSIHQPSYRVFTLFHKIYVLSRYGMCIFDDSPFNVLETLENNGVVGETENVNPADLVMEVAAGETGSREILMNLSLLQANQSMAETNSNPLVSFRSLEQVTAPGKYPSGKHFTQIVWRSTLTTLRDPWLFGLRTIAHVFTGIFMGFLFGQEVGQMSGCPPTFSADFDPTELEEIQRQSKNETDVTFDNSGNFYFGLMVVSYTALMPTVLTFPSEMVILVKEKRNQWYGIGTYYLAKSVADIPFQIIFPVGFGCIIYLMTGQILEIWRFLTFLLILVLTTFAAQSQGILLGAILMHSLAAAVFIAPVTMNPVLLFSGFFIKVSSMPNLFIPSTYLFYYRFGFESLLGAVYGFGRCGDGIQETMVAAKTSLSDYLAEMLGAGPEGRTGLSEEFVDNAVKQIVGDFVGEDGVVRSSIMNHYDVTDEDLFIGLLMLVAIIISYRVLAYFIVVLQANAKH